MEENFKDILDSINTLHKKYRSKEYLETIEHFNRDSKDLVKILEKYNIEKRPLSKLLGFGELTITRYLDGQLPSVKYVVVIPKVYWYNKGTIRKRM